MRNPFALAICMLAVAPLGARGEIPAATDPARGETTPAPVHRQTEAYDRAALLAQLQPAIPCVQQQAAAVGRELASRALLGLAATTAERLEPTPRDRSAGSLPLTSRAVATVTATASPRLSPSPSGSR